MFIMTSISAWKRAKGRVNGSGDSYYDKCHTLHKGEVEFECLSRDMIIRSKEEIYIYMIWFT